MFLLTACGSGGGSSSPDGAGACPAVCNTLALPAVVMKTADPAPRPAFTGGAIADGTYDVNAVVRYGSSSPGGVTVQESYRFAAGAIESAIDSSEASEMHYCGSYTTTGNTITLDVTCPTTASITLLYTADATSFTFQHGSDQNEVATAVKQ